MSDLKPSNPSRFFHSMRRSITRGLSAIGPGGFGKTELSRATVAGSPADRAYRRKVMRLWGLRAGVALVVVGIAGGSFWGYERWIKPLGQKSHPIWETVRNVAPSKAGSTGSRLTESKSRQSTAKKAPKKGTSKTKKASTKGKLAKKSHNLKTKGGKKKALARNKKSIKSKKTKKDQRQLAQRSANKKKPHRSQQNIYRAHGSRDH